MKPPDCWRRCPLPPAVAALGSEDDDALLIDELSEDEDDAFAAALDA